MLIPNQMGKEAAVVPQKQPYVIGIEPTYPRFTFQKSF